MKIGKKLANIFLALESLSLQNFGQWRLRKFLPARKFAAIKSIKHTFYQLLLHDWGLYAE